MTADHDRDDAGLRLIVLTPQGLPDPALAIAATRAGALGVLDLGAGCDPERARAALEGLARHAKGPWGLKIRSMNDLPCDLPAVDAGAGFSHVVLDAEAFFDGEAGVETAWAAGLSVIVEFIRWDDRLASLEGVDALIAKGHEAGGRIGEETTFILLQKAVSRGSLPVYARGGIGLHTAGAVLASGAAGAVLDNQLLLCRESPLPSALKARLARITPDETGVLGDTARGAWRVHERPGFRHLRSLRAEIEAAPEGDHAARVEGLFGWSDPGCELLPLGQDAGFAPGLAGRFATAGGIVTGIRRAAEEQLRAATESDVLGAGSGVAGPHGTRWPIVQGPMTRVSDSPAFAEAVARAGGLPMLALALMRPEQVDTMLAETQERLGDMPWGVGLLGFASADLVRAQVDVSLRYRPRFALIAGGRPEQARALEEDGIPSYLHVPSPRLLEMFLEQGASRFVFEGRECGGHVGPLSSFVLWGTMVETLLARVPDPARARGIDVLFAGGIHDALSAAMVAAIAAPLAERGVRVGVLMGSAYLFTREIVESGAIVPGFQAEALACAETVNLETGPGHASRCGVSPFATHFQAEKRRMIADGFSGDEVRETLESLTLGRLRVASKATGRDPEDGRLVTFDEDRQKADGMYMWGQAATILDRVLTTDALHRSVTEGARALLKARAAPGTDRWAKAAAPADIAVIGIGAALPGADDGSEFWENILDRVEAIREIPRHRWDWRLYFDEDRSAPDRIYSRWGGFLDDMPFDPFAYGIPPKAVAALDPLQLMTLDVARRTLEDAGYGGRDFGRERVSIMLGASGGAGDVGAQYAVRSELPRFMGELEPEVAERLPEWTEDSFAGILLNVAAGRTANRLDVGGLNFTVDAACASALAAVYQGVSELIARRSDMCIVGGVDTVQGPFGYLCFSKTQALSPRGQADTFSQTADGIVISEGIAMVALKRLEDAERDGDRIYAVIKGIGGSSDGRARSMTAPHPDGQIRALTRAYEMAGYAPRTVSLFEAHGTGTVAGDGAELETITRLLKDDGAAAHRGAVGSVKTLIGHTKATAGVAGLVKTVLALHHRVIPPHGRLTKPLEVLMQQDCPVHVPLAPLPWVRERGVPRRAGVSAFGFGGTNFHVTLEEYADGYLPDAEAPGRDRWRHELLVWRSADRPALAASVRSIADQLAAGALPELRDLAASLAGALPETGETAAIVLGRDEPAAERLYAFAAHLDDPAAPVPPGAFFSAEPLLAGEGRLALVFPGQGTQYPGMLREVAVCFPEVREAFAEADAVLASGLSERIGAEVAMTDLVFGRAVYDEEREAEHVRRLTRTDVAQPALGLVEAAVLRVLRRLGLSADMACGHSYGEFVALHAAGVLSFEDLLRVSAARGRFMVEAAEGGDLGTMMAVQAPREEVEAAIAAWSELTVANHNAPAQSIVSGPRAALDEAASALEAKGLRVTRLTVGAAFHSPIVAPASERFGAFLADVPLQEARFPVYSNTTAAVHEPDAAALRDTLARQLAAPVEFVSEIEAMHAAGARVFLSAGPKTSHAALVDQILDARPHRAVALDDGQGGLRGLLAAVGALLAEGASLDPSALFAGRDCRALDLADLASGGRRPKPKPHMWMLNGSGARRVGDPLPQPLTLEEVEARKAASHRAVPGTVSAPAASTTPHARPAEPAPSAPAAHQKETTAMFETGRPRPEDTGPHPGDHATGVDDRAHVLAHYQETMRKFLQTQESVMLAYLGNTVTGTSRRPLRTAAAPLQQLGHSAPAALPQPTAAPVATAPVAAAPVAAAAPPQPAAAPPAAAPAPAQAAPPAAPAPAPERPSSAASAPAASASETTGPASAEALTDVLLGIVEDRTGYPRDMLGLDQNLEADLGIDSIKRVEIVGALIKSLAAGQQSAAGEIGETLNAEKTLKGIVATLWGRIGGQEAKEGATGPFDRAGTETSPSEACARPFRYVVRAHAEPAEGRPRRPLPRKVLVTEDGLGVADAVAARLEAEGVGATILEARDMATPEAAVDAAGRLLPEGADGLVHLAALGAERLADGAALADWRAQVERVEAVGFALARHLGDGLADGGAAVFATGMGGVLDRLAEPARSGLAAQGGAAGLAKSLREEWPGCAAKAVDLDLSETPEALAGCLVDEMALAGGRIEVGYPAGRRMIFRTEAEDVATDAPSNLSPGKEWVILAIGGARGITAETLRPFAACGARLVLVGRSALPGEEASFTADAPDADSLRKLFVARARAEGRAVTPVAVEREVQAILRDREMRANIADLAAAGAEVEYRAADVRDEDALAGLLDALYAAHGRIDVVLHGAGVIEDRRIADKTLDSWRRVVGTKLDPAFLLARHLRPETLKALVFFTSVAGRFGNSGQADYAAANEVMNRLALQLHARWKGRVRVISANWGPWLGTTHGAGMVSAETRRKFEARGIELVDPAAGAQALFREVTHGPPEAVEIVFGAGPWERHEAEAGAFAEREPGAGCPAARGGPTPSEGEAPCTNGGPLPFAAGLERVGTERGNPVLKRVFHLERDCFLGEHLLDGTPVLPAAGALEVMAEAAAATWPDWTVAEVADLRVLSGMRFEGVSARSAEIVLVASEHGDASGFRVAAQIRPQGGGPLHYRATLGMAPALPEPETFEPGIAPAPSPVTAGEAYRRLLFHGPLFQTMRRIRGLDRTGAIVEMGDSRPGDWISGGRGAWLFDPGLIDAGPQMAIVWASMHGNEICLPSHFGTVRRYGSEPLGKGRMIVTMDPAAEPPVVRADVVFVDDAGRMRLAIEDMECTRSAALNRLCGWSGLVTV